MFRRELLHQAEHFLHPLRVQRGCRLVEQDHVGIGRHRSADAHALLLASGERGGIGIGLVGQADALENLAASGVGLGLGHAVDHDHALGDVLQRSLVGEQRIVLEHERRASSQREDLFMGRAGRVETEIANGQMAGIGRLEKVDAAQQG